MAAESRLNPRRRVASVRRLSQLRALTRTAVAAWDARSFLESEDALLGTCVALQLERFLLCTGMQSPGLPERAFLLDLLSHTRELLLESNRASGSWGSAAVCHETLRVPTMLSKETMTYSSWLGGQLCGVGDIVELGVWLGSSTLCVCEGVSRNSNLGRRPGRTHVVLNEYGKLDSWAMWRFCSERSRHLVPLHKPRASTKTFLYI
jgi:hypothetical protein